MKDSFKHFKKIIPLIALACIVIFPPWELVWAWVAPLPDTVQEQVDTAIAKGFEGIIVHIDQGGKTPVTYTAGYQDRVNQIKTNPNALFKIASISKLYIAAATAKIINDGRLSLDDTLADHLPTLVGKIENAERITLKMLISHRSGIPNFTNDPAYPWGDPHTSTDQSLNMVLGKPAEFSPDSKYKYSNTNYLLIGDILDKTLGYSHHKYIKEEILVPLGVINTYSLLSEVDIDDVVSGYYHPYHEDLKELEYIMPGGSMVATAQDVGIFLRALIDGTLLNKAEQDIYSSMYEYEHTGLLPGYQSIARYHKDIDAVVIQFVNTSGGNMWTLSSIGYDRIVKILRKQIGSD